MRQLQTICLILSTFIATTSSTPAQKQSLILRVEDALDALSFGDRNPINLSPDGKWVAYTTEDLRKKETVEDEEHRQFTRTGVSFVVMGCTVWIANTQTGEAINLTGGQGSSWGPVWSPSGDHLAFFPDHDGQAHLWIWEKTSKKIRRVSDAIVRTGLGYETVRWSPDSKKVLVKVLEEGLTLENLCG